MSVRRLVAVFTALLALALVATLPLGVVLRAAGVDRTAIAAVAARGSVWSGRLENAALGGNALGNIDVGLSPLRLLTGTAAFRFAGESTAGPSGIVEVASGRRGVAGLTASLPVAGASTTLALAGLSATFDDGSCARASGGVSADVAVPGIGSVRLSGNAACDGDRLLLPMTGATPAGDAKLDVRVGSGGDYAYVLMLRADPSVGPALAAAGFATDEGGFSRRGSGRL
jgi:hypothetical protein